MENMNEQWKEIPGIPGYFTSNLGHIKGPRGIIKGHKNKDGYVQTSFKDTKGLYVHRLVALTWIPNPDNKKEVDHINGIRDDNHVKNLRWTTSKENQNNPITLENMSKAKKGENHPLYGTHPSEETRKKRSESKKRAWEREKSSKKVSRN